MASNIVLYTWPGHWDLPSWDPSSLAAVIFLQLALPGGFTVAECTNPDSSPSGQLPYIVHDAQTVSTFPSIVKYVSKVKAPKTERQRPLDLDLALLPLERAQSSAWLAHVSARMGDLVAYVFYSLDDNWTKMTKPAMAAVQPIPQRYYLPDRVRESYKPRLESVGLWGQAAAEKTEKKPFEKPTAKPEPKEVKSQYLRVFERQKVEELALSTFDVYNRLLGDNLYFYQNQCTSLDILLAAHILPLLKPPFPDPYIQNILREKYPTLVDHSERILALTLPPSTQLTRMAIPTSCASLFLFPRATNHAHRNPEEEAERKRFTRMRWSWIALAGASVAYYVVSLSMMARARVLREGPSYLEQDDEEEEEEEEVGEEDGEEEE
ncbi:hypothetical protein ONZ45_g12331 [Pleurotus djamor]|nr:hypothetical protein ONZ45_g12331 [Pleurotus djamor]